MERMNLAKKVFRNSNFTWMEVGDQFSILHIGIEEHLEGELCKSLRELSLE